MPVQIKVDCPHCHQAYRIRDDKLGRKTNCRNCGTEFVLQGKRPGESEYEPVTNPGSKQTAGVMQLAKAKWSGLSTKGKGIAIAGVAGVGILFLALLFIFTGAGNGKTDAGQYTSTEFNEIVTILRDDPEMKHGLLFAYDDRAIPLALCEAVFGKPESVAKPKRDNQLWTYQTKDGGVTVLVSVFRDGTPQAKQAGMPFLWMKEVKFSVALGDKTADREELKNRLLAIRSNVDRSLPDDPHAGKSPDEIRKILAQRADDSQRKERDRLDREFADQTAKFDRLTRDRETADQNRRKAESDFHDGIKGYYRRNSPERAALAKQETDWMERRKEAIEAARKNGKDWKNLPLPNKAAVSAAIAIGKPVPVIGVGVSDPNPTQNQKPSSPTVGDGKAGTDTKPKDKNTTKLPTTKPTEPNSKPPGKPKTREQRIAELREQALNKKVTLKAPYTTAAKNGRTDRITIQFAVKEIGRQAGFNYDFETSIKNTDPICRQFITPSIQNKTCRQALDSILRPAGLEYTTRNGAIILKRR